MSATTYLEIPLDHLEESPDNPRRTFDRQKLSELAESIVKQGVLQPIVVRVTKKPVLNGEHKYYEIVAGARRFRAAKIAELETIPAIVRELNDQQMLEVQVIENLQREDIDPFEECEGFQRLLDSGKWTIADIAERMHVSLTYVHRRLKLRSINADAKKWLEKHELKIQTFELVATLTQDEQKELLQDLDDDWHGISHLDVVRFIQHNFIRDLAKVPFDTGDKTLLPVAGACTDCPKNSANGHILFPELLKDKSAKCLDAECMRKKKESHVQRELDAFLEKYPDGKTLSNSYPGAYADSVKADIFQNRWSHATEKTKGALPGLLIDRDGNAKLQYYRPIENKQSANSGQQKGQSSTKDDSARKRRLEELRLQRAENCARFRIYETCIVNLDALAETDAQSFVKNNLDILKPIAFRLVTIGDQSGHAHDKFRHPGRRSAMQSKEARFCILKKSHAEKLTTKDALKAIFIAATSHEISFNDNNKEEPYALETFAKIFKLNTTEIREKADFDSLSKKQQQERLSAKKKGAKK